MTTSLLPRLEKCSGPDRTIDGEIYAAIHGYEFFAMRPESEILLFFDRKHHGDNVRIPRW